MDDAQDARGIARREVRRTWPAELREMLANAARRGRGLSIRDATRLAWLYRVGASDLLRARSRDPRGEEASQRERLMRQAYVVVYAAQPTAYVAELWRFLTRGFPRLVRREWRCAALAALLICLGALCGGVVMALDPDAAVVVIPDMHQEQTPLERVRGEAHHLFDAGGSAVFSSFLFTHNIQVTFLVFALGLSFGIGTACVLFLNGIPLGALAAQYFGSEQGLFFLAWILPHGVVELSVVTIAGAAGFVLARGLVRPGPRPRPHALYWESKRAVQLVLGGMPLLVVAGLVEGTVSQVHPPQLPYSTKLAVAALLALLLLAYLGFAGRGSEPARAQLERGSRAA